MGRDPGLGNGGERGVGLVEHSAPLAVDAKHGVRVKESVMVPSIICLPRTLSSAWVGRGWDMSLGQASAISTRKPLTPR